MSLVLSYLPTPSQREDMIQKARRLLVSPGYGGQPHRTGLLLIVEKESIFNKGQVANNEMEYIHNWRTVISKYSFELVKYRFLKAADGKNMHAFAFAATEVVESDNDQKSYSLTTDAGKSSKLWITQDFNIKDKIGENVKIESSMPIKQTQVPIGIVGGGLGGCALALSLQKKGLPFILFEKDKNFSVRKQGYALTMQQGGTSLRLLGLSDDLLSEGVISTAHYSYNKEGVKIGAYGRNIRNGEYSNEVKEDQNENKKTKSRHNIHIPRQRLRELLLKDIQPESISWDKSLSSYIQLDDGNIKLIFADGTNRNVSVLIGADGNIYLNLYQFLFT